MASPMAASYLKIARAKKHLAELEQVIQAYIETNPVRYETTVSDPEIVGTKEDGTPLRHARITFKFDQDAIPEEMSAIVGDIVHNLRSALDLMATELCRAEDDAEDETHFPFAKKESEFGNRVSKTGFWRAGPEAIMLMSEFAPYEGGNAVLRAIHDLDIRDKHKRLIINAITFGTPIIDIGPAGNRHPVPKIIGDPTKPSELKLFFPQDTALATQELVPTLHLMVETTASIVEAFKLLLGPAMEPPVGGDRYNINAHITLDATKG